MDKGWVKLRGIHKPHIGKNESGRWSVGSSIRCSPKDVKKCFEHTNKMNELDGYEYVRGIGWRKA